MAREKKEFSVDGIRFESNQFGGVKGNLIFAKLLKLIGEPIAAVTGKSKKEVDNVIQYAVSALSENLEPDQFCDLVNLLLSETFIYTESEFRRINIDEDFAGKILLQLKVIKEVLAFNYSDFLAVVAFNTTETESKATQKTVKAIKAV